MKSSSKGAITGLKVALVLQLVFALVDISRGEPIELAPPLLYVLCVGIGAVIGANKRGGSEEPPRKG